MRHGIDLRRSSDHSGAGSERDLLFGGGRANQKRKLQLPREEKHSSRMRA